ncbi:MAG: DUF4913 domain-containing protein [Streptosporangiaceae bacterium]
MTHSTAHPPPATGQDEVTEPLYPSVQDWVTKLFLPMYRRPLGGEWRWCGQWWRHAEAIMRLTALWHSWEAMRLQPGTGTANWLRDHLDHQLPVLLGRNGPFAQCSEDEHIDPRIASADPWPPGWWDISGDDASAGDGTAAAHPKPVLPADSEPDGGTP